MSKGDQTRQAIIAQAVPVFNQHGYAGTSIGELMQVTGLSKGAIYNHFENKDDLAIQVFEFAVARVQEYLNSIVRQAPRHAIGRLVAIVGAYEDFTENAILAYGCPVLNTAVEADDTHPVLRAHAQEVADGWYQFVVRTLERGIYEGQVRPDLETKEIASLIISSIEGGIMMSKLEGNSSHINRVVKHLIHYLETEVQA